MIKTRLKTITQSIREEQTLTAALEAEQSKSERHDVTAIELKVRIERTIKALESTPKEKQREVFANAIQFAEIHPTKIKLGVFATNGRSERQSSAVGGATGTPGSNVYSILSGSQNRRLAGSHTIKIGGVDGHFLSARFRS